MNTKSLEEGMNAFEDELSLLRVNIELVLEDLEMVNLNHEQQTTLQEFVAAWSAFTLVLDNPDPTVEPFTTLLRAQQVAERLRYLAPELEDDRTHVDGPYALFESFWSNVGRQLGFDWLEGLLAEHPLVDLFRQSIREVKDRH